ncbi:c-type cytochrome [Sphingomonas sp. QA11]|uniref:c-type cytochrome n=1 Tax=Sphingomonas sp. QA11 TaxID=2950605 RepID=UPI002349DA56|nr:c-type cytochrome [Sphingomonas sp. QA11]WCM28583.1 c-type cytochrome [Sphingomonas sp. QA11]
MPNRLLMLTAIAGLAGCSPQSASDTERLGGDPRLGQQIAQTRCAACHGSPGVDKAPGVPTLNEQYPEYLKKQLAAFAAPAGAPSHRESAVMAPIVRALSEADRSNVAAWYAQIWRKPSKPRDPARVALGEQIFLHGKPEDDLPACAACHRMDATGIRPDFPNLASQEPAYLEYELRNWERLRGHRGKLMSLIAPRIKPELAGPLADYLAMRPSKPVE